MFVGSEGEPARVGFVPTPPDSPVPVELRETPPDEPVPVPTPLPDDCDWPEAGPVLLSQSANARPSIRPGV